jgi:hypothetical protein
MKGKLDMKLHATVVLRKWGISAKFENCTSKKHLY